MNHRPRSPRAALNGTSESRLAGMALLRRGDVASISSGLPARRKMMVRVELIDQVAAEGRMGLMASIKGPASRSDTVVTVRLPQPARRRVPSGFFLTLSSGLVRMRRMGAPVPCLRTHACRPMGSGL